MNESHYTFSNDSRRVHITWDQSQFVDTNDGRGAGLIPSMILVVGAAVAFFVSGVLVGMNM